MTGDRSERGTTDGPDTRSEPRRGDEATGDDGPRNDEESGDGRETSSPDEPAFPRVSDDRLAPWTAVERKRETLFEVSKVRVRAATVVYEDREMRERVVEATGVDRTWRFFFASRLQLRPATKVSRALTRLVTNRARSGFPDQLRARGFTDVEGRGDREFRVGSTDATLCEYDATVNTGTVALAVDGWLAVWPDDGAFLLAGGAYPTSVAEAGDRPEVAGVLRDWLEPGAYRAELFELIRATS